LFFAMALGGVKGSLQKIDGRYYRVDRGVSTEVTRDQYLREQLPGLRFFAGVPLLFAAAAAVALTAPASDDEVISRPSWWPHRAAVGRGGRWQRARGFRTVSVEVPGTLDEVLARLRLVIPVTATVGGSVTTATIEANWRTKVRGHSDVLLEGSLDQTLHGTTRAELELGLQSQLATWFVLPLLWGSVFVAIGIAMTVAAFLSADQKAFAVFGLLWTALALVITLGNATNAWRVGRDAADQVTAALEGRALRPSGWARIGLTTPRQW